MFVSTTEDNRDAPAAAAADGHKLYHLLWAKHCAEVRVSQPQHYWCLRPNNGGRDCPVWYRTFSSTPGTYPLDACPQPPPAMSIRNIFSHCLSPQGVESPWTKCLTHITSFIAHSSLTGKPYYCPCFSDKPEGLDGQLTGDLTAKK